MPGFIRPATKHNRPAALDIVDVLSSPTVPVCVTACGSIARTAGATPPPAACRTRADLSLLAAVTRQPS